MPDYTLFHTKITLLTPLHIGSGRELMLDYDYTVHRGCTWRINEDALLDAQDVDDPAMAERLARTPPAQLLRDEDYREDSPFFHYVLKGTPRARQAGAQLREQIKDPWQRPYLPGTSLKGALRTALAWHGFRALKMKPDARQLHPRRKWAAQRIEREIMGKNPNFDLLRALHVGDSAPVGPEQLMLVNAQVLTRRGTSAPIELEALRPETVFHLTMKLDEALFSDWARKLGLGQRAEWLRRLPQIVQAHTAERVETERRWYSGVPQAQAAQKFYAQLAGLSLPEKACVLQVGWGGGWDSKTLGSVLRADERFMEDIIAKYRLARGKRHAGEPFPKSRRTAVRVLRNRMGEVQTRPNVPLGWVLMEWVEMEKAK